MLLVADRGSGIWWRWLWIPLCSCWRQLCCMDS